jgi:hypothetical protein
LLNDPRLPAVFWDQVREESSGCLVWTGVRTKGGYGLYRPDGGDTTPTTVHRAVYAALVGPIAEGHQIDHLCHVAPCLGGPLCPHRRCVRPDHLEAVTAEENIRRAWTVQATHRPPLTHCRRAGHEYTEDNTHWVLRAGVPVARQCRACHREADRRYRQRRSEGSEPAGIG